MPYVLENVSLTGKTMLKSHLKAKAQKFIWKKVLTTISLIKFNLNLKINYKLFSLYFCNQVQVMFGYWCIGRFGAILGLYQRIWLPDHYHHEASHGEAIKQNKTSIYWPSLSLENHLVRAAFKSNQLISKYYW